MGSEENGLVMLKLIGFALLAVLMNTCSHAGGLAPKQNPDNFSSWDKHLFVGALPGLAVGTIWPEMHLAKQFAMCSVPGLIHEFNPAPGNVWSPRDILVNSIGCGAGLFVAGYGVRWFVSPQYRTVGFTLSIPLE